MSVDVKTNHAVCTWQLITWMSVDVKTNPTCQEVERREIVFFFQ